MHCHKFRGLMESHGSLDCSLTRHTMRHTLTQHLWPHDWLQPYVHTCMRVCVCSCGMPGWNKKPIHIRAMETPRHYHHIASVVVIAEYLTSVEQIINLKHTVMQKNNDNVAVLISRALALTVSCVRMVLTVSPSDARTLANILNRIFRSEKSR